MKLTFPSKRTFGVLFVLLMISNNAVLAGDDIRVKWLEHWGELFHYFDTISHLQAARCHDYPIKWKKSSYEFPSIKIRIRKLFPTEVGKKRFEAMSDVGGQETKLALVQRKALALIDQEIQASLDDGGNLRDVCNELLGRYSALADDELVNFESTTKELIADFPDGFQIEHH